MYRHQRVVVALSDTETDREPIAYARMLANSRLARHFYFVHARDPSSLGLNLRQDVEVLETCESLVTNEFSPTRNEVAYGCHIASGPPVDALVEFASKNQCGTILLGHRRNRSGQRSLARRLAMIAPCSIWLVPEDAPVSLSKIMVPVDFSDHSADAVEVATAIVNSAGVTGVLAPHVASHPSMVRHDQHQDEIRKHEQESFQKFIAPIDTQGIAVTPHFLEGNDVARTLLHAANQHDTDLIIMSTRGRSRAASILLGSITTQVMVESPVAVFAVKHFGAMLNLYEALRQAQIWKRPTPKTN